VRRKGQCRANAWGFLLAIRKKGNVGRGRGTRARARRARFNARGQHEGIAKTKARGEDEREGRGARGSAKQGAWAYPDTLTHSL